MLGVTFLIKFSAVFHHVKYFVTSACMQAIASSPVPVIIATHPVSLSLLRVVVFKLVLDNLDQLFFLRKLILFGHFYLGSWLPSDYATYESDIMSLLAFMRFSNKVSAMLCK